MADQRPRVAIVGAGPSGLAAAHHLAGSHQVWLFEIRSDIGGVWAKSSDQAYDWLETNTPIALFPFPGFPLADSDWEHSSSSRLGSYIPATVAQRYYARYARAKELYDGGRRIEALKLDTKVLSIKRPTSGLQSSKYKGWLVTFQKLGSEKQETLSFERLIIATGSFSSPTIPKALRMPVKEGIAFHSSIFGSSKVKDRLSESQKIYILSVR